MQGRPGRFRVPRRALRGLVATSLALGFLAGGVALSVPGHGGSAQAAVLGPTTTTPVPAVTVPVGLPAWWSGNCDATHWDAAAASMGWDGVGSHPLGASYLGVPVCGPRPWVDGSPNVLWQRAGWGEAEWQCVELAQRFMAQIYGTRAYGANGSGVVSNYRAAYGGGLVRVANGTAGRAPVPGDIISFTTPRNVFGHVVVVSASNVDLDGNGTLTLLSQNDTPTGWRSLAVVGWRVQTIGSLTPYGWLHDPLGRGDPLGEGSFIRVRGAKALYRVVGGAPVLIHSWADVGGAHRFASIDPQQFARLRSFPRDGTFITDTSTRLIYRFAGGAPLEVAPSDAALLPGWRRAPNVGLGSWNLQNLDHMRATPADGTVICRTDKACFTVAGGSPLVIRTPELAGLAAATGVTPVTVSVREFGTWKHLRDLPADGTLVCDADPSQCYQIVGGAPLRVGPSDAAAVPGWTTQPHVLASHWEFVHFRHLHRYPTDGTLMCRAMTTRCFVIAGGSPLVLSHAALTTVPAFAGRPVSTISAVELSLFAHLTRRPAEGTYLLAAQDNMTYRVTAGVARYVASSPSTGLPGASGGQSAAVVIDRAAVDNAGLPGSWSRLRSSPPSAPATFATASFTTSTRVGISWTVPVGSSAVTGYDVAFKRAALTGKVLDWTIPRYWRSTTATRVTHTIDPGTTYCFRVRAHNRAGQTGAWSPPRCTATTIDDPVGAGIGKVWHHSTSPAYYGGTSTWTTAQGASWLMGTTGVRRVGFVVTTCPTCGSVRVAVAGHLVGTIVLVSPTLTRGVLVELPPFPLRAGPVHLVVTSPKGRLVQIEGVGLSRV